MLRILESSYHEICFGEELQKFKIGWHMAGQLVAR